MNNLLLSCQNEQRRHKVRESQQWNGLDYVEVEIKENSVPPQAVLRVYFLGKAPRKPLKEIGPANVRISGGQRIRDIQVVDIDTCYSGDPELDDCLEILVEPVGDFSTYTLCLVDDEEGRPTDRPFPNFDPRYACLPFSFKVACLNDLDCQQTEICPPKVYANPDLNYLAKDYASFRRLILDRLALTIPDWQERHVPDIGLALVEILAYTGDYLSYYQDAVATEAYLNTARQRISVRRHARLVDYMMHEGCNARAFVSIETEADLSLDPQQLYFITGRNHPLLGERWVWTEADLAELNRSLPSPITYEIFEPLLETRYTLRPIDIKDLRGLVSTLTAPRPDQLSRYIWSQFSPESRDQLKTYVTLPLTGVETGAPPGAGVAAETPVAVRLATGVLPAIGMPVPHPDGTGKGPVYALVAEFNHLLQDVGLYLTGRSLEPTDGTRAGPIPQGEALIQANRHLLEKKYDNYLQPSGQIQLYANHHELHFYTWGDQECYLPQGATRATLVGHWRFAPTDGEPAPAGDGAASSKKKAASSRQNGDSGAPEPTELAPLIQLDAGDILIFEEVIGPKTGAPADADPAHRHAVRLTRLEPGFDALYSQPVVEIEWALEDALPFPLCLSALGPAPHCEPIENISVARGNIILVDHGWAHHEGSGETWTVAGRVELASCRCEGQVSDAPTSAVSFRPALQRGPLVFSQPLAQCPPASRLLAQDPRQALPWLQLTSAPASPALLPASQTTPWKPRPDLLSSDGNDPHFVAEIDNEGRAWLRFGDGEVGRRPAAGEVFTASYRLGGGPAGNVGAEAISHLVTRPDGLQEGVALRPRNPLPAQGGLAPEPVAEVKQFAPFAFRTRLQRAITPQDYADLAMQHPKVQRAAASRRWTGSWYEMLVVIDPLGQPEAPQALLDEMLAYLYPYRAIGHEVVVRQADYVPLDIALDICVKPGYLQGHVKAALLDRFSNRLLPGGQRGFFHPDNLTFGDGLALSRLVATAQAVTGVESVEVTRLQRMFGTVPDTLATGLLPLGPMEVARLDNDPSQPENGRLELELSGGR